MKKKRNPSKHVFILANKTTSSTLFYLFFVFNEKNRAHIDIYYNFYSTFATSKQAKNKGIMSPKAIKYFLKSILKTRSRLTKMARL